MHITLFCYTDIWLIKNFFLIIYFNSMQLSKYFVETQLLDFNFVCTKFSFNSWFLLSPKSCTLTGVLFGDPKFATASSECATHSEWRCYLNTPVKPMSTTIFKNFKLFLTFFALFFNFFHFFANTRHVVGCFKHFLL